MLPIIVLRPVSRQLFALSCSLSTSLSHPRMCQNFYSFSRSCPVERRMAITGEKEQVVPNHSFFLNTPPPQTAQLTCPHPRDTPQVGGKPLPTPVPLNTRGYKWRCERGESDSEDDRTTEIDPMARHITLMFFMACLVWTTCSAAPMQCHFNSQGESKCPVS